MGHSVYNIKYVDSHEKIPLQKLVYFTLQPHTHMNLTLWLITV